VPGYKTRILHSKPRSPRHRVPEHWEGGAGNGGRGLMRLRRQAGPSVQTTRSPLGKLCSACVLRARLLRVPMLSTHEDHGPQRAQKASKRSSCHHLLWRHLHLILVHTPSRVRLEIGSWYSGSTTPLHCMQKRPLSSRSCDIRTHYSEPGWRAAVQAPGTRSPRTYSFALGVFRAPGARASSG
jgi:hypothetical protein